MKPVFIPRRVARVLLAVSALWACGAMAETVPADPPMAANSMEAPLGAPAGKRVAPPEVAPVTIGDIRFEAVHWGRERGLGQNGGYIAAIDAASGKELWTLKIYSVDYDPALEWDVQDVFIESMSKTFWSGKLDIRDEKGRRYRVDPRTRTVERR